TRFSRDWSSDVCSSDLFHRAKSHASAHAGDDAGGEVIRHELVPRNKPTLVTDARGLDELVASLRAAGSFAYDSEFIGELSYVPRSEERRVGEECDTRWR